MMEISSRGLSKLFCLCSLIVAGIFLGSTCARAGLTVDIHIYHDNNGYFFYPYLNTNTTTPNYPVGDYLFASPQYPTNGSEVLYSATATTFNECINGDCGGGNYYNSFDDLLNGITNGLWSIWVTNGSSTTLYNFAVTVSGLTSNVFGANAVAIYPIEGAQLVAAQPQFSWSGPANWEGTLAVQDYFIDTNGDYNYVSSDNLPGTQTTWTSPTILPNGTNDFTVDYQSNVTAMVVADTPTNGAGQPISGWISTATLETDFINNQLLFVVGQGANPFDVYLVGRYNFENTNFAGQDSSGNGNDANCSSSGGQPDVASTNAAVGNFARLFFGDSSICFGGGSSAYPNLSNALTGSFTVTAWVNTTNSVNSDYANAYFGAAILFLYDNGTDDTVPLSITGSKAAFTIDDQNGNGTTIHSTTTVNDGTYHFLAVTRDASSGLMSLYVDGNLEATGTSTTQPLQIPTITMAGGWYADYAGLLDDVRIYSTNLAASDIATIDSGSLTFATALHATNLDWLTSGDAGWFIETTNTYNSLAAAQSGGISNYQSSILTAIVTGPGNLTFDWSCAGDSVGAFDYEFDIDGTYADDIYGQTAWYQEVNPQTGSAYVIPAGQHTLTWTTYAYGDTDPTEAGFLDNVTFTLTDTNPVSANITLNIYREQDPNFGNMYIAFPSFNSVTPPGTGTTTNTIESPNGAFYGHSDGGSGGSSSDILFSFSDLLNDLTNGPWSLYINKGLPNQRLFQFNVSVTGLTTNLLSPVQIITPTNGAGGVSANTPFQWTGPTNFSSLNVSKQNADGSGQVSVNLALTATNWPSPPTLDAGTNQFNITYTSNNFTGITFSIPVDTNDSQTVSSWMTQGNLLSTAGSVFTVVAGPLPATLTNARSAGTNFQFSFLSQAGFTNIVQYRTNLIYGQTWQTYSNVLGDGTLKTILIPYSLFSPSRQGYVRIATP